MVADSLRVLRHREFATVWTAVFVSDLGTWMQIAALGIYAVGVTGHATWVGILTTVTYISSGLLFPLGGAAADRHDRRRVIGYAVSAQAVLALLLWAGFTVGSRSLLGFAALAAGQGALSAYVNPAREAMIPDLVPAHEIPWATSLVHVSWNAGRALGPLLAVSILEVTSYAGIFLLNGVSFVFIAGAMATVAPRPHPHHEEGSTWHRVRTGVKGLRSTPACRWPVAAAVAEMVLAAPFIALIPVMAQIVLGGRPVDSARLFAAQGAGSALGVMLIGSLIPRYGQGRVVMGSLLAVGALGIVYAFSGSIGMAVLVILPLSAVHTSVLVGSMALLQRDAPLGVRGRIISLWFAFTNVGYGISSELQAPAADRVGLRIVLAAGSGTLLVAGLIAIAIGRRRRHHTGLPAVAG